MNETTLSLYIPTGWRDPLDYGLFYREFSGAFSGLNLEQLRSDSILRHTAVTNVTCADPAWMQSDTFYPAGTICGLDLAHKTCFDTGDSGIACGTNNTNNSSLSGREWTDAAPAAGRLQLGGRPLRIPGLQGCCVEVGRYSGQLLNLSVCLELQYHQGNGYYLGDQPGIFSQGSCCFVIQN